jgi:hypothetical protein
MVRWLPNNRRAGGENSEEFSYGIKYASRVHQHVGSGTGHCVSMKGKIEVPAPGTCPSLPITSSRISCLILFSHTRHQPILNLYCFSTTLTVPESALLEVISADIVNVEYKRHLSNTSVFEYNLLGLEM